jgi:hypothetical protein
MREHAIIGSAAGLVPAGHLCWAYRSRAEYYARALEYAENGITAGQYVEYVGEGSTRELRDELTALAGSRLLRGALEDGQAGVCPASSFYRFREDSGIVDPDASAAADGYTGLRIVADCTLMARTCEQREAFARYEYLLDQQMAPLPAAALCAYDLSRLGRDAVAELACLHPFVSQGTAPFQLYASPGAAFGLAGDIDAGSASLFPVTLERIGPVPDGLDIVIDARALEFIDHRGLFALDQYAAARGRTAVLRTTAPGTATMARLLAFKTLRLEAPPR